MSHRVIEKRRRDRMNNCLADLSRLIPAEYLKKGRGRVEKTEIIEMAIKHMQYLQNRANLAAGIDCATTAPSLPGDLRVTKCEQSPGSDRDREAASPPETASTPPPMPCAADPLSGTMRPVMRPIVTEHYRLGYQECLSEAMHFLVEVEGYFAGHALCVKLNNHLQKHCDKIVKGDRLNFPRTRPSGEATSSSGSSSSYGNNTSKQATALCSSAEEASGGVHPPQAAHPHHGMVPSQLRDILCASPPSPSASHHQYHAAHVLALGHHGLPQHYDLCADNCTDAEGGDGLDGAPHLSPHHSPHHGYSDQQHHHSYKFKNTFKQRFSEEHSSSGGGSGSFKRRRPSPSPSPSATPITTTTSSQHTHATVPIFVLHTKGAFYIPLKVSYETLAPYLDGDLLSDSGSGSSPPQAGMSIASPAPPGMALHPVTISVNFQQHWRPAAAAATHPHPHPPAPVPPLQTTSTAVATHAWARGDAGNFYPPSPWDMCVATERP